jgi:peptide deformylase
MVFNEVGSIKFRATEIIMVNPEVVAIGGAEEVDEEGCLSFPDIFGNVLRSNWVDVKYQGKGSMREHRARLILHFNSIRYNGKRQKAKT